jgi:hypothetical protein
VVRDDAGANAAALKKSTCERLNAELQDIRSRQRAGGDVESMEALRQQYLDVGNRLRTTRC